MNNPLIANPIAKTYEATNFIVTGITPSGCEASDTISVKVMKGLEIYVPNSFTPNGDHLNDVIKAIPVGITTFNYFAIFNRFGQKIFYTVDPQVG